MTDPKNSLIVQDNPVPDGVFCMHDYTPWSAYKEEGRTQDATVHDLDIMNMKASDNGKDRQSASITRVAGELAPLLHPPVSVVVVPPSDPTTPKSGLHGIAKALGKTEGIEDQSTVLRRIAPKQAAHHGGDRSLNANLTTLEVSSPDLVVGKRVLLLDDMSKTGNTIQAARQLLLDAGAARVEAVAIGCTKGATPRE